MFFFSNTTSSALALNSIAALVVQCMSTPMISFVPHVTDKSIKNLHGNKCLYKGTPMIHYELRYDWCVGNSHCALDHT